MEIMAHGVKLWLSLVLLAVCGCATSKSPPPAPVPEAPPRETMSAEELKRVAIAEGMLNSAEAATREKAAVALLSMSHQDGVNAVLAVMKAAPDPAVRVSMVKAVEFTEDRRCFNSLLHAVADPDGTVQQAAARALGRFSRPAEVAALVALLDEPSTGVARQALLLRTLGDGMFIQTAPALLAGLENEDPRVREAARQALEDISGNSFGADPQMWRLWWKANRTTTREEVLERRQRALTREVAAARREREQLDDQFNELFALSEAGGVRERQLLIGALGSGYSRIREYAALRLDSMGVEALKALDLEEAVARNVLRGALDDESMTVRLTVVRLLAGVQPSYANGLLLEALADAHPKVLLEAIKATAPEMGQPAVQRLIIALAATHPEVREAAANALGKMGNQEAVRPLVQALNDEQDNVRWFAVESLRKLNAAVAAPQLAALLRGDKSARVRQIAATTLGELGRPDAVLALREALHDENERVQAQAVAALKVLARDDFDRMMIIADAMDRHGHTADTRDVLRRAIQDFGAKAEMQQPVMAARGKLAATLKAMGDLAGAAGVYAEIDSLKPGDQTVRSELIECWLASGQEARVEPTVTKWLQGSEGEALDGMLTVGCGAVERLTAGGHADLAAVLLESLTGAAAGSKDEKLVGRIAALKAAVDTPAPEDAPTPE